MINHRAKEPAVSDVTTLARSLGQSMARLEAATDPETYQLLQEQIVAECEKDAKGIMTDAGLAHAAREFENAVWQFEDAGYDDSIERAERAAGA